jgi:hypothetical protein
VKYKGEEKRMEKKRRWEEKEENKIRDEKRMR